MQMKNTAGVGNSLPSAFYFPCGVRRLHSSVPSGYNLTVENYCLWETEALEDRALLLELHMRVHAHVCRYGCVGVWGCVPECVGQRITSNSNILP